MEMSWDISSFDMLTWCWRRTWSQGSVLPVKASANSMFAAHPPWLRGAILQDVALRPCSIQWFHPRFAWLKPPSDTPNCSTSDHHIPRFPWNPYEIHMKSIWNPYVHGRRRSSSLLVAALWSYGISLMESWRCIWLGGISRSIFQRHSNA